MPSDDQDHLQSLIAEILEAEAQGEPVDRDGLLTKHPEHAGLLRDFFANHDRMKSVVESDDPTLSPDGIGWNDPTIPPGRELKEEATMPPQPAGDDPTIPPIEDESQPAKPTVGDQVRYFGDYELLEEIARGGMGVVFKARQINLNRVVALKMILAGQFAGEEDVQRFYTEAEAAANLDHPGIVPIFEIGEHQGQHYFSMGYIEGESLAHKVNDGPLPPRKAAELVQKICDAMAYAHERGVIHRDLKPANILVDENDQPKITDFGLAKKTGADSNLTGTGQVLGTPAYMPPEQAAGRTDDIGPLADIYSLGAILYCLLTGRPPFQAASPMDTLLQVLDKDPISPCELNESVPADLGTISLKCLSKQPGRRYHSGKDLATELGRYLNGEPIAARPIGRVERSFRLCKRNPTVSALCALAVCLLVLGSVVSTYFAISANHQAAVAIEAKENAQAMELKAEWRLYANQIASVQREWGYGSAVKATAILDECRDDFRGWEHRYLKNEIALGNVGLFQFGKRTIHASFSHGAKYLVTSHLDGQRVWDIEKRRMVFSRKRRPSWAKMSADGKRIVCPSFDEEFTLEIWESTSGRKLLSLACDGLQPALARFSNSGKHVVCLGVVDKGFSLALWDTASGDLVANVTPLTGSEDSLLRDFRADNDCRHIATLDNSGVLRVYDSSSGTQVFESRDHGLSHFSFSPSGRQLAMAGESGVQILDVNSGERLRTLNGGAGRIASIVYREDGERIAANLTDHSIRVWETASDNSSLALKGPSSHILAIAFSADGRKILSADLNGVRAWGTTTGENGPRVINGEGSGYRVVFSPDGKQIASCNGKTLTVRNLADQTLVFRNNELNGEIAGIAFTPDGKRVVTCSYGGDLPQDPRFRLPSDLRVWDLSSGRILLKLDQHQAAIKAVACSKDGTRIVSGGNDNSVVIWDASNGRVERVLKGHVDGVDSVAFSPSGKTIASVGGFGGGEKPYGRGVKLKLWDTISGAEQRTIEGGAFRILCLAFSPDGELIVGGGATGVLKVWSARSGTLIHQLKGHDANVNGVAFHRDGERMVSAGSDGLVKFWELETGQNTFNLKYGHPVECVAFNPNGDQIVAGSPGSLKLWSIGNHSIP